jgi:hypothetical protein
VFLSSRERALRASKTRSKTRILVYTAVETTKIRQGVNNVKENHAGNSNIGIPASFGRGPCRAGHNGILLQTERWQYQGRCHGDQCQMAQVGSGNRSYVTPVIGDLGGFMWVDTYPDIATWGKIVDADSGFDAEFDAISTCSSNRMLRGEETVPAK